MIPGDWPASAIPAGVLTAVGEPVAVIGGLPLRLLGEDGGTIIWAFGHQDPAEFCAAAAQLTQEEEEHADWDMTGLTPAQVQHVTGRLVRPWCARRVELDDPAADPADRAAGICPVACGAEYCADWGLSYTDPLPGETTFPLTLIDRS